MKIIFRMTVTLASGAALAGYAGIGTENGAVLFVLGWGFLTLIALSADPPKDG